MNIVIILTIIFKLISYKRWGVEFRFNSSLNLKEKCKNVNAISCIEGTMKQYAGYISYKY